jgi:hypothetical protein
MAGTYRLLSTLLDNSSSTDMTVNGSSTPVTFTLTAAENTTYYVRYLTLTVHSSSMDLSSAADMRVFGAAGALSNGVQVYERRGPPNVDVDLFPSPIKSLVDFFRYASWSGSGVQVSGHTDGVAAGTDTVSITYTWPENRPLTLRSGTNDTLTVNVRDDLTGLTLFEAHAVGTQELARI